MLRSAAIAGSIVSVLAAPVVTGSDVSQCAPPSSEEEKKTPSLPGVQMLLLVLASSTRYTTSEPGPGPEPEPEPSTPHARSG